jgi:hypothetical protein
MEQLLVLAYGDSSTDTTVFPAATAGGTGLSLGGSANPSAPAAGYVDWLDVNGNPLAAAGTAAPAGWYYKRVWQVSNAGTNLKQITVSAIVANGVGAVTLLPQATMTALKTSPF